MLNPRFLFLLILIALSACIETQSSKGQEDTPNATPQVPTNPSGRMVSLLGTVLPPKQLSERVMGKRLEQLEDARKKYESDPENLDNIIWYGRRMAYLGRYQEAIRIYSIGLDLNPNSYRLLRHRGHRYITVRKFDAAIEDLQRAAFYARPAENKIEPDGLPNRLNKPLSNDKFNIWYHLGIAYYLKGNYDKAISSFKKCITYADNDDLIVATTDWFYMTYRKIGNLPAAQELLAPISRRMNIVENYAYHQRLMMYQGHYQPEDLLDKADRDNDSIDPTIGYGVANWYLYNGQVDIATELIDKILRNPQWDGFGYIAAEVDKVSLGNL